MKSLLFKSKKKVIPKDIPKFITKETNGYLEFKGVLRAPKEVLPTNKMDSFRKGTVVKKNDLDLNKLSKVGGVQERKRIDPKEFIIEVEDFSLDFLEEKPKVIKEEKPKVIKPEVIKEEKPEVIKEEKPKVIKPKLGGLSPKAIKPRVSLTDKLKSLFSKKKVKPVVKSKVTLVDKLKSLLPKKKVKPKVRKPRPTKPRPTKIKKEVKKELKPRPTKIKKEVKKELKPRPTKIKKEVKKELKPRPTKIKRKLKINPKEQKRIEEEVVNNSSSINNLLNSETYGIKNKGIINKHEKIGGGGDSE